MKVKRLERGWAGHFICANQCRFRRNTLLTYQGIEIVVSTVGLLENSLEGKGYGFNETFSVVGYDRYYETMAFYATEGDTRYHDADVSKRISFGSPWTISEIDADDKANDMHEVVVEELTRKLKNGEL